MTACDAKLETTCPAAGVHHLEIPLPYGPGSVSVYLMPIESGWLAIDCGPNTDEAIECYRAAGIRVEDIRIVLLTHAHPDHCGLAARLRSLSGAEIFMHAEEAAALAGLRDPKAWLGMQDAVLETAGVPADTRQRIRGASLMMHGEFPKMEPDGLLSDGDVFPTACGLLRVVHTPGHTAGHLCFYLEQQQVLFAGDHLLFGSHPQLDWVLQRDLAGDYLDSLYRLVDLDIRWVLSGHGRPKADGKTVLTSVLARFWERGEQIGRLRSNTPETIAKAIYARPLSPFEHRMAVYEVLSYLRSSVQQWQPLAA